MRNMLNRFLFAICLLGFLPAVQAADAATDEPSAAASSASARAYISDDVYVYLHSGPSKRYRIIGTLKAGEPITVLSDVQDEFIQIRDGEDREGWIQAQWVQQSPSLRVVNSQLSDKVDTLQQQLDSNSSQAEGLRSQLNTLQQKNETLQTQLRDNERKLMTAEKKLDSYDDKAKMEWFIRGGAVGGIGLLAGVILSFLPRRRKKRDDWV